MLTETNILSTKRWLCGRLREIAREMGETGAVTEYDVRLCIWPESERVLVMYGPVDYDTEHAPICAAAVISGNSNHPDIDDLVHDVATDLIDQAIDQLADFANEE